MSKTKGKSPERKLAEKIAESIFTCGNGEKGDLLRMYTVSEKYLGGWSEGCLASHIEQIISSDRRRARARSN